MHPYVSYLAAIAKHEDDLRRASRHRVTGTQKPAERHGLRWLLGSGRLKRRAPIVIDLTAFDLPAERDDVTVGALRPGIGEENPVGD